MKRSEVYQLIDGERDYQESLWPVNPLAEGEFIALLQDYVNQARAVWVREPKPCQETMGIIRKIAAIAVNALEQHGAPARGTAYMVPQYAVVDEPTNQVRYEGPAPITDAELEAAITDCWKRRGLPAAKNILALFGVERVGAIPAEKRAEALLEMKA